MCRANRGSPPSPCVGQSGGIPPPPTGSKEGVTSISKILEKPRHHDESFTRNAGYSHAKMGVVSQPAYLEEGAYPPFTIFSGGGIPPTHVPGQQGITPLPLCWTKWGATPSSVFVADAVLDPDWICIGVLREDIMCLAETSLLSMIRQDSPPHV